MRPISHEKLTKTNIRVSSNISQNHSPSLQEVTSGHHYLSQFTSTSLASHQKSRIWSFIWVGFGWNILLNITHRPSKCYVRSLLALIHGKLTKHEIGSSSSQFEHCSKYIVYSRTSYLVIICPNSHEKLTQIWLKQPVQRFTSKRMHQPVHYVGDSLLSDPQNIYNNLICSHSRRVSTKRRFTLSQQKLCFIMRIRSHDHSVQDATGLWDVCTLYKGYIFNFQWMTLVTVVVGMEVTAWWPLALIVRLNLIKRRLRDSDLGCGR